MDDAHYPKVPLEVMESFISNSDKVIENSNIKIGSTSSFYLKGNQAIYKRTIQVRDLGDGVGYESSTGLATRLGFMGSLLEWFVNNRNWKDGGYFVPQNTI